MMIHSEAVTDIILMRSPWHPQMNTCHFKVNSQESKCFVLVSLDKLVLLNIYVCVWPSLSILFIGEQLSRKIKEF